MSKYEVRDIDKGYARIMKELLDAGKPTLKVGYPSNAHSIKDTVYEKAIVNEVGSLKQKIPPRPFMKQATDRNIGKIKQFIKKSYGEVLVGKLPSIKVMLERLGIYIVGRIQREITSGSFVPNSPSTIAKKGSSNPLIDTGELRQSTTYTVES